MMPSRMPTSERYQGFPEPSMTCAPEMTRSNTSDCPKPEGIASNTSPSVKNARLAIVLPPQDGCDLLIESNLSRLLKASEREERPHRVAALDCGNGWPIPRTRTGSRSGLHDRAGIVEWCRCLAADLLAEKRCSSGGRAGFGSVTGSGRWARVHSPRLRYRD